MVQHRGKCGWVNGHYGHHQVHHQSPAFSGQQRRKRDQSVADGHGRHLLKTIDEPIRHDRISTRGLDHHRPQCGDSIGTGHPEPEIDSNRSAAGQRVVGPPPDLSNHDRSQDRTHQLNGLARIGNHGVQRMEHAIALGHAHVLERGAEPRWQRRIGHVGEGGNALGSIPVPRWKHAVQDFQEHRGAAEDNCLVQQHPRRHARRRNKNVHVGQQPVREKIGATNDPRMDQGGFQRCVYLPTANGGEIHHALARACLPCQ
ncbi:hypothetical protein BC828DRAFT_293069 [Blastocladiella britannica]|nr:hypothetical protein BC828DRAFT_293069 [Blastocladiella britannica]